MSGIYPRNKFVKKGGIRWDTADTDFPEVKSEINQYGTPRYPEEKQQTSTFLTWMTPEEVKQKQIALFNQRRGNEGQIIFARKNMGYEKETVHELKEAMKRGDTFTPLTFYHDRFGNITEPQEGAHRTHAIIELGAKKVPVWLRFQKGNIDGKIMKHYPETEHKISKYKRYEVGEVPDDIGDFGKRKVKQRMKVTKFYGI